MPYFWSTYQYYNLGSVFLFCIEAMIMVGGKRIVTDALCILIVVVFYHLVVVFYKIKGHQIAFV